MRIVIIGGTGRIGARVVIKLREQHHEAVAAALDTGVNTVTGEGVPEALEHASVVVDVTDAPSYEDAAAFSFFQTSTRNLLDAEAAAGVGHHVVLSVVGTDSLLESGYFRAKLAQEQLVASSAIPYTVVRATQFFEFVKRIAHGATDGDTVRVPPRFFQPAAIDDVASALGRIALGEPKNGTVEVAGPELFRLDDLVRLVLEARGDHRQVVADPDAPYFGARLDDLTLVPGESAELAATRFHDWLDQQARTGDMTEMTTGEGGRGR